MIIPPRTVAFLPQTDFVSTALACFIQSKQPDLSLTHEQTIRSAVECSGVGLHSGAPVSMRMLPAPSGTGIVFRRTDLDGFEIEAVSRNVARVSYATSLMKKGVLISTTEHVLSAFIGVGIDNAIVELDNLELPDPGWQRAAVCGDDSEGGDSQAAPSRASI